MQYAKVISRFNWVNLAHENHVFSNSFQVIHNNYGKFSEYYLYTFSNEKSTRDMKNKRRPTPRCWNVQSLLFLLHNPTSTVQCLIVRRWTLSPKALNLSILYHIKSSFTNIIRYCLNTTKYTKFTIP